jgi:hypothetical protein
MRHAKGSEENPKIGIRENGNQADYSFQRSERKWEQLSKIWQLLAGSSQKQGLVIGFAPSAPPNQCNRSTTRKPLNDVDIILDSADKVQRFAASIADIAASLPT